MINFLDLQIGLVNLWEELQRKFLHRPQNKVLNGYLKLTSEGPIWETLPGLLHYQGACTWSQLPTSSSVTPPQEGDVWTITDRANTEYFYKYYSDTQTYDWEPMGASMTNYITESDASTTNPLMDGTASYGSATRKWAREDHVHPSDTSKQDTSTAVTHAANTAVGAANKPVYVASDGAATACTFELNKSVPSDAVFTDTTYSDFGASGTNHSAGLVPDPGSTAGTTKFLCEDGTWKTTPDNNTTYTFAEGTTDGAFSVTPSGGSASSVSVHNVLKTSGGTLTGQVYFNESGASSTAVSCTKKYNWLTATSETTLTITTPPQSLTGPCEVIYAVKNNNASGGSDIILNFPTAMPRGNVHNMIGLSSFTIAPLKIAELVFTFWSTTEVSFNGGVQIL